MPNIIEHANPNPKTTVLAVVLGRGLAIILGAILMAVGLEIFLVPNNVVDGGITGISIMLSHISGWKLGVFLFLLNIAVCLPWIQTDWEDFCSVDDFWNNDFISFHHIISSSPCIYR